MLSPYYYHTLSHSNHPPNLEYVHVWDGLAGALGGVEDQVLETHVERAVLQAEAVLRDLRTREGVRIRAY